MKKVNVAVVGFGHLGRWHTQKANGLENANLIAIVEPFEANQVKAKEAYPDVKIVNTVEDIMNEVDAFVVVTPTSTHYELSKTILKNKKHLFCEKPLCSTFAEAKDLESFIEGSIVQVGHSERCHEAWEKLRSHFMNLKGKKTIKIDRFAPFKGRATDVDVVQDLMIHDIDLMLFLFGQKPVKLSSIGHKIRTDKCDHVTSHFYFDNGDEVIITSGRNHVKEVRSLEVVSSEGCTVVDLFTNEIHMGTSTMFEDGSFVKTETYEKRDHLLIGQDAFYSSILNNQKAIVTYEDGLNAVYYVDQVIKSIDHDGIMDI